MRGLLARLRALDARLLPSSSRNHEGSVRHWWAFLLPAPLVLGGVLLRSDAVALLVVATALQSAFMGGWYYNEACRRRRTPSPWPALESADLPRRPPAG